VQTRNNPAWAELVQLIPIITFALPFIVRGEVDLARASSGFLLGAVLALLLSAVVMYRKYVLNPILVGAGLWLCLGAVAFNLHLAQLSALLIAAQGFGLFAMVLAVGLVTTLWSPQGYIGRRHQDARWVRRTSMALLALSVIAVWWAYSMSSNIRLGGGLPFIVLNVARRMIIVRSPQGGAVETTP
jgi:hypothetical protein